MKQYYIIQSDGTQQGPLDEEFVREQYACGAYENNTQVWSVGMTGFAPIDSVFPEAKRKEEPQPTPASSSKQYYIINRDGQQQGPLDEEFVRKLYTAGAYKDNTKVWTEGMPDWAPIATVFPSAKPSMPPPPPSKKTVPPPPPGFTRPTPANVAGNTNKNTVLIIAPASK